MQKNTKWLSEKALQIAVKRRKAKGKEEKERYTHLNTECLKNYGQRFMTLYRSDQDHPQEEEMQKGKIVV